MPGVMIDWLDLGLPADGTRRLCHGESLFRAGDSVIRCYRLVSGHIRLQRPLSHGEFLTVHRAAAGALLAEASLFSDHYHCDAVAEDDCEVIFYARERVRAALADRPLLAEELCHYLSREVQGLRTRLELAHIHSADERVLTWIRINASSSDGRLWLDRPLKQVATELGLAHETLYRSLRHLLDQGLIRRDSPDQIQLCD